MKNRPANADVISAMQRTIEEMLARIEAESAWGTFSIELVAEAGKVRLVRRIENQTFRQSAVDASERRV